MNEARVLGIAGWSGSGKTVLITRLIPEFANSGLRVATLKHAHHAFDVDQPGKDSWGHRAAGACEVIVSSARRWAQMHEIGAGREATLAELLGRISPCDLILVEGFKSERHPKLEVFRRALGLRPLHTGDASIVAIAGDQDFPDVRIPVVPLNDVAAVAAAVRRCAQPLPTVLATLAGAVRASIP